MKKNIDKDNIKKMEEQLYYISKKYSTYYNSTEEMLGVLTEEYHELIDAVRAGKGKTTDDVYRELIDIAVVCFRGARAYKRIEATDK